MRTERKQLNKRQHARLLPPMHEQIRLIMVRPRWIRTGLPYSADHERAVRGSKHSSREASRLRPGLLLQSGAHCRKLLVRARYHANADQRSAQGDFADPKRVLLA